MVQNVGTGVREDQNPFHHISPIAILYPTNSDHYLIWAYDKLLVWKLQQVIAYLLMAAAAASSDVAYISKNGLDYIGWMEHCSYYSRFCSQAGISLVLTYFSMLIFAIQSMLSAHQLFTSMALNTWAPLIESVDIIRWKHQCFHNSSKL